MNCHDFEQWIALDVGGDLPEADRPEFQAHLRSCPRCQRFAEEIDESRQSLSALHRELLDVSQLHAIRTSVIERLEAEADRRQERFAWLFAFRPGRPHFAVLAASLVVALGLAWWSSNAPGSGDQVGSPAFENLPDLAQADSSTIRPMPGPNDSPEPESSGTRVQTAALTVPEASAQRPRPKQVKATDATAATPRQPQSEPRQQETPVPPVQAEQPLYELVTVAISNSEGGESEQYLLRVASDNPDIEIYWMLDENGG